MQPKFANRADWNRAEQLMQPALIRTIDNIRKALERTQWKGRYEEVPAFPPGTPEETQTRVRLLQQQLASAPPDRAAEIDRALEELPQPYPGYFFHLERGTKSLTVDLWELCYRVCFRNFQAQSAIQQGESVLVEVDGDLFDETGDVDWTRLDEKSQQVVEAVFARLT